MLRALLSSFLFVALPLLGDIRKEEVGVPMRDGVHLKAEVYYDSHHTPSEQPLILIRTPLINDRLRDSLSSMSKWGYTIAIQKTRHHTYPELAPIPYLDDGWGENQDGHDTIEWFSKSMWSNGKIGTFGESAQGIAQYLLAPTAPSHLGCQYVKVATPSLFHCGVFSGGALLKNQVEGWFQSTSSEAFETVLQHPHYDALWDSLNVLKRKDKVNCPIYHATGWYDIFLKGTLDAYLTFQEEGGPLAQHRQKLVIGPWDHYTYKKAKLGDFDFPLEARQFNEAVTMKEWFDFHLKGIHNKTFTEEPIHYYVMGPFDGTPSKGNRWEKRLLGLLKAL